MWCNRLLLLLLPTTFILHSHCAIHPSENAAIPTPSSKPDNRPNIVLILTDDVDLELGTYAVMNRTRHLIEQQGVRFHNAFATTPVCCPSRSSILTGRYQHSHNVVNNTLAGNCAGDDWRTNMEPHTFGSILHDLGYATFYSGKYLNQYGYEPAGGTKHVPPGWDFWAGLVGNSQYYDYVLSVNGTRVQHGNKPTDYLTDVISNYALQFLDGLPTSSSQARQPFLMVCAPPAAHAPFQPAPKYVHYFTNATAPRTPAFGIHDDTKSWLVKQAPPLDDYAEQFVDLIYRKRLATLMSVDDLVESVITRLETMGELQNTFIFFTSDHGFHLGQFNLRYDKRLPYEFDIRIPLAVRGPNITANTVSRWPALNIDLAPTFVELAGGQVPPSMDGRSMADVLYEPDARGNSREFLLEYHGEGSCSQGCKNLDVMYDQMHVDDFAPVVVIDARNLTYSCLRRVNVSLSNCTDCLMCDYEDNNQTTEMYDLDSDPYELTNLVATAKQILLLDSEDGADRKATDDQKSFVRKVVNRLKEMGSKLHNLRDCSGASCN